MGTVFISTNKIILLSRSYRIFKEFGGIKFDEDKKRRANTILNI